MTPRCGPGKVLCVLAVTQVAPSRQGSWNWPPRIRPSTWAPSYRMGMPFSRHTSASSRTGSGNRMRLFPSTISRGAVRSISSRLLGTSTW